MRVVDVMVKDIKATKESATVKQAAEKMAKYHVGSLLVLNEEEEIVGIITEWDVLSKFATTDKKSSDMKVSEIMSRDVITIKPEALLEDAADLMNKYKIKKLPVVLGKRVIGIITAREVLSAESALLVRLAALFPIVRGEEEGSVGA